MIIHQHEQVCSQFTYLILNWTCVEKEIEFLSGHKIGFVLSNKVVYICEILETRKDFVVWITDQNITRSDVPFDRSHTCTLSKTAKYN